MRAHFFKFYPSFAMFILAIAPLPFIALACSFYFETEKLALIEERLHLLSQKQARCQAEEKKEKRFLEQLKQADQFYLNRQLETLSFQEVEINKLKIHSDTDEEKKRLQFLQMGNRLTFLEESQRTSNLVREVEQKQESPIEVNEDDLKRLLMLIENIPISSYPQPEKPPQLIIRHLSLTKKQTSLYQSVFLLNMHLIKREGTHP